MATASTPSTKTKKVLPEPGRMHPFGRVNTAGLKERAEWLSKRSIKKESKLWVLRTAISMCDLTTLEGSDTDSRVVSLCSKAKKPYSAAFGMPPDDQVACPPVAAVCVYPNRVALAAELLRGTGVRVASVATGFPSGQYPLALRLEDTKSAVADGADEVDMVINRAAFLSGDYAAVYDEIAKVKECCGAAQLKVILETGELGSYDAVRNASFIAMQAGADFIKTSTGKISPASTLPATLCMLEAIRDYYVETGVRIGMKPAGGIRTAKDAIKYVVLANETLGPEWLTPKLFRIGASSLVNDLLSQIVKQITGVYRAADEFSDV